MRHRDRSNSRSGGGNVAYSRVSTDDETDEIPILKSLKPKTRVYHQSSSGESLIFQV